MKRKHDIASNLVVIAVAMENARLIGEAVENAKRQEAALEIGKYLVSTLELNDLLRAILRKLLAAVDAQTGSFFFYNAADQTLRGQVAYGVPDEVIREIIEPVDLFKGLKEVLHEDRPLAVKPEETSVDGRRYMEEFGLLSTLILPLVFKDKPIGVTFVSRTRKPADFDRSEIDFAMLIARQAAVAIENTRLFNKIELTATAEHARREELEAVINSMDDGVAVVDPAGRISLVNPFGAEIVKLGGLPGGPGGRPEELDLTYAGGRPVEIEDLPSTRALAGAKISGFELVIGARRGRPRILSVSAAPFRDTGGEIVGAAVVFRDVTEGRRAQQDLHRRNRELQIISEISSAIARTLDLKTLIEQAADRVLALLEVDMLAFYLLDEETMTLKLFTSRGVGAEFVRHLSEIRVGEMITGQAVQTGLPIAIEDTRKDPRTAGSPMAEQGLRSFAGIPVKSRGKVIGVMPIMTRTPRRFADRDLALLSSIGNQIGSAVENARLFEREKGIAQTLQESLLGKAPTIPGFDIGVVYAPAYEVAQVGGDFFDFIEFTDGAVGVIIGDVSGKGLNAATLTAMAKNTVRAFAYENRRPSQVLARANEVLAAETAPTEFVTLLFLLLDLPAGKIIMSSAGHPSAFICNDLCLLPTAISGLPLGAFSRVEYADVEVEIMAGQSLILYTDGLTDARTGGRVFGMAGIERIVMEHKDTAGAQELAEYLVKASRDFAGGRLPDDVAIIVLRLAEPWLRPGRGVVFDYSI